MLLFFHGSGYCSGSIVSHRQMVTRPGVLRAWLAYHVCDPA
jgi:hypothetical protein